MDDLSVLLPSNPSSSTRRTWIEMDAISALVQLFGVVLHTEDVD